MVSSTVSETSATAVHVHLSQIAVAALYGGGGVPANASDKAQQIQSFEKFALKSIELKADVLLSNHENQDDSIYNFEIMKVRPADTCGLQNPFVIGIETYVRYLRMNSLCVRVQAARSGQSLNV
jgi:metallo-beta-lactamase class B